MKKHEDYALILTRTDQQGRRPLQPYIAELTNCYYFLKRVKAASSQMTKNKIFSGNIYFFKCHAITNNNNELHIPLPHKAHSSVSSRYKIRKNLNQKKQAVRYHTGRRRT